MKVNHIYQGDALEVLQSLEAQQVDMCVTSPPYWGLRDYGVEGQLGLEQDFNEYIDKLCTIFDEVKRVLKDEGTCWVNLGDSYSSGHMMGISERIQKEKNNKDSKFIEFKKPNLKSGLNPKCLIGIPFRFAIEMINRGWILRNTIIWHKPNCMPSSVKDRFTVDFEYLFFFSKNKKYYFEQQTEPVKKVDTTRTSLNGLGNGELAGNLRFGSNGKQRNMRTVWNISTKPYKGAHFAVFPEELIETPIKAGCPTQICNQCQTPRTKQYDREERFTRPGNESKFNDDSRISRQHDQERMKRRPESIKTFTGYSDCGCDAGFHPGIVLDPFMGSGTTAAVAKRLNRNYVGIELNPEYHGLIHERLDKTARIKPLNEYYGKAVD